MPGGEVRVLIVDDELAIRRFLRTTLQAHGYVVDEASRGEQALNLVALRRPDVIVLDLGLPEMDGIEVTRRLREWSDLPILILSVRGAEADKVAALDAGADDYLTKPFGVRELMARLRAIQRRATHPEAEPLYTNRDLTVDLSRRQVEVNNTEVQLTPTEYELLQLLVAHAGKVVTRKEILRRVWGTGYDDSFHLLRVNISNLRHKLEPEPARPRYIITEPGVGYRLREVS